MKTKKEIIEMKQNKETSNSVEINGTITRINVLDKVAFVTIKHTNDFGDIYLQAKSFKKEIINELKDYKQNDDVYILGSLATSKENFKNGEYDVWSTFINIEYIY